MIIAVLSDTHGNRRLMHAAADLAAGTFGVLVIVPLHDTKLIAKVLPFKIPPKSDPLTRVLGWKEMAQVVGKARAELLAEGKPVFLIGDHYGITSLLTFYTPEAKQGVPENPLVFFRSTAEPRNQFYFWPGYRDRKGQNAIYVRGSDRPMPAPESLQREFETVTDLGMHEVIYKRRVLHRVQLFACRDLR